MSEWPLLHSDTMLKRCSNTDCQRASNAPEELKLRRCSKCKVDSYCSRTCQRCHWEAHRLVCSAKAAGAGPHSPGAFHQVGISKLQSCGWQDCKLASPPNKGLACFSPSTARFKVCGKCRLVRYCSVECQKMDWPLHRNGCKAPEKAEPGADADSEPVIQTLYHLIVRDRINRVLRAESDDVAGQGVRSLWKNTMSFVVSESGEMQCLTCQKVNTSPWLMRMVAIQLDGEATGFRIFLACNKRCADARAERIPTQTPALSIEFTFDAALHTFSVKCQSGGDTYENVLHERFLG